MTTELRTALSLSPTWLRGEAWRDPANRVDDLLNIELYVELAQRAEAAHVDFLLKPDTLGVELQSLGRSPGFTTLDPVVMLSAVAAATSRIGLVPTVSASVVPPYLAARTAQSLDLISRGRAGLNLVMGLGGGVHVGLPDPASSAERYARAGEYVDVLRRLWASYPADAIIADRDRGVFADTTLVRPIDHDGEHFSVRGPIDVPAFAEGGIPIVQAGGSSAGQEFAAGHADVVFGAAQDPADGLEQWRALHRLAARHGRDVGFMPGLSVHLARSSDEARRCAAASQGDGRGAAHWTVTGTPQDAVSAIAARAETGGLDGFVILPGSLRSAELMLDEVLPALARMGLVRSEYRAETLAGHLAPPEGRRARRGTGTGRRPEASGRGAVTPELIPLHARTATVVAVDELSPRMRRVVLHEPGLGRTLPLVPMSPTDHVKLVLPGPDGVPRLPEVVDDRLVLGAERPEMRDYTVRAIDAERSLLTLDLVLHGHGPAGRWAAGAEVGQHVGVLGPRGTKRFPAGYGRYLLAVDETGLPALGRFLEELPESARVTAFVQVADADGRIELPVRAGLELTWLDESAGQRLGPEHLAVSGSDDVFVWLAGEADALKPLRRHLLRECGLRRDQVQVEGYWRRGVENHDHHQSIDTDDDGEAY